MASERWATYATCPHCNWCHDTEGWVLGKASCEWCRVPFEARQTKESADAEGRATRLPEDPSND